MNCSGASHLKCGGYLRIGIYHTGLNSLFYNNVSCLYFKQYFSETKSLPLNNEVILNEPPIKVAYILTVNGRSLRQVHRLIKVLYHRDHLFYIHVDAVSSLWDSYSSSMNIHILLFQRQEYLFRELLPLESQYRNIKLSRERFSSIWGGASLLSVLLSSMKELLDYANWDFVINLSESDFPIK